ncbi:putative inorganic phosphate cotransporter [Lycorma delicatula]|uniref:putative inorganic phosphate cotransporter n=1 Tax=Lycorma delicatula TaxID=130591 RepID=UPI003F510076
MAFLGIAILYMMRNCLSMAITEMAVHHQKKGLKESKDACKEYENITRTTNETRGGAFDWSEEVQGHILASFYYGYIFTQIPGGLLADWLGGKQVLGFGALITAISTLCCPASANIHYNVLIAVRFLGGLASGVMFPAVNVLLARWIPLNERARMGALVFAGTQIGNVLCNSISGLILKFLGWPSVFIIFGTVGVVWYIIWFLLCYNEPDSHPFISDEEKEFLHQALEGVSARKDIPRLPLLSILTSLPVWALMICQFGHNWGLFTMQNDLPKYMSSMLKYSAAKNGFLSSLPFLAMWITAIVSGWISDFLTSREILSVVVVRKLLTLISQVGPGFGCLFAVYAGCHRILVVALFTIGMGLMGPFYPSMRVNALDLAPNYAGFLMALVSGFGSFAGALCSQTIGWLVKENTFREWELIFWISNLWISFSGIFYVLFGQAKLQKWNNPNEAQPPPPPQ